MIRTEGLSKTFGGNKKQAAIHAVQDLNLDIEQGEFVAFMGPSGSGKTTLHAGRPDAAAEAKAVEQELISLLRHESPLVRKEAVWCSRKLAAKSPLRRWRRYCEIRQYARMRAAP